MLVLRHFFKVSKLNGFMMKSLKADKKQKMFCSSTLKYSIIARGRIHIWGIEPLMYLNLNVWLN